MKEIAYFSIVSNISKTVSEEEVKYVMKKKANFLSQNGQNRKTTSSYQKDETQT